MCVLTKEEIKKLIVEEGLIRNYIDLDVQLQPNGFDCTLQKVFKIIGVCKIDFDNTERKLADFEEMSFDEWVFLKKGVYKVRLNEIIKLPKNLMAIAKPRSTLARSGISLITAIWDAGYEGRSEVGLVVHSDGAWFKRNARIIQLVFIKLCKQSEGYGGIYLRENL